MAEADVPSGAGIVAARSAAFDRLPATATLLDPNGIIIDANQAWRLFGQLNEGVLERADLGISYLDVCDLAAEMGEGDAAAVATGLRQILAGERERFDLEYPCSSPTEERWFLLEAAAVPVDGGTGVLVLHIDITSTRRLRDRLHRSGIADPLTGLPGRQRGLELLGDLLGQDRVADRSILYVNVIGFGSINFTYGFHVGDEVLVKLAARAAGLAGPDDHVCRVGNDELLVIHAGGPASRASFPERMRQVLEAPIQVGAVALPIRVAIGTATSGPGATVGSLLTAAIAAARLDEATRSQAQRTAAHGADPSEG